MKKPPCTHAEMAVRYLGDGEAARAMFAALFTADRQAQGWSCNVGKGEPYTHTSISGGIAGVHNGKLRVPESGTIIFHKYLADLVSSPGGEYFLHQCKSERVHPFFGDLDLKWSADQRALRAMLALLRAAGIGHRVFFQLPAARRAEFYMHGRLSDACVMSLTTAETADIARWVCLNPDTHVFQIHENAVAGIEASFMRLFEIRDAHDAVMAEQMERARLSGQVPSLRNVLGADHQQQWDQAMNDIIGAGKAIGFPLEQLGFACDVQNNHPSVPAHVVRAFCVFTNRAPWTPAPAAGFAQWARGLAAPVTLYDVLRFAADGSAHRVQLAQRYRIFEALIDLAAMAISTIVQGALASFYPDARPDEAELFNLFVLRSRKVHGHPALQVRAEHEAAMVRCCEAARVSLSVADIDDMITRMPLVDPHANKGGVHVYARRVILTPANSLHVHNEIVRRLAALGPYACPYDVAPATAAPSRAASASSHDGFASRDSFASFDAAVSREGWDCAASRDSFASQDGFGDGMDVPVDCSRAEATVYSDLLGKWTQIVDPQPLQNVRGGLRMPFALKCARCPTCKSAPAGTKQSKKKCVSCMRVMGDAARPAVRVCESYMPLTVIRNVTRGPITGDTAVDHDLLGILGSRYSVLMYCTTACMSSAEPTPGFSMVGKVPSRLGVLDTVWLEDCEKVVAKALAEARKALPHAPDGGVELTQLQNVIIRSLTSGARNPLKDCLSLYPAGPEKARWTCVQRLVPTLLALVVPSYPHLDAALQREITSAEPTGARLVYASGSDVPVCAYIFVQTPYCMNRKSSDAETEATPPVARGTPGRHKSTNTVYLVLTRDGESGQVRQMCSRAHPGTNRRNSKDGQPGCCRTWEGTSFVNVVPPCSRGLSRGSFDDETTRRAELKALVRGVFYTPEQCTRDGAIQFVNQNWLALCKTDMARARKTLVPRQGRLGPTDDWAEMATTRAQQEQQAIKK